MHFPVTARFAPSPDSQLTRVFVSAVQTAPVAVVVACAAALAWREHGSIAAGSWLPYSIALALLGATVLLAGVAARPSRTAVVGIAALAALGLWDALSLLWAPSPALARDEALLTITYAVALAIAVLTLWTPDRRLNAIGCVVALSGGASVAACAGLVWGDDQLGNYYGGRLGSPILYVNATGALFALGFWPALLVAARRDGNAIARALALGAGAAALSGAVMTQSKGATLGLAAATIVVFALAPMRLRLVLPFAVTSLLAAAAFSRLTEPYREAGVAAIQRAGATALTVTAVAVLIGLPYALVDAQLRVPRRTSRQLGIAVIAAVAAAAVAGVATFLVRIDHPVGWFQAKWQAAHHYTAADKGGSTHLVALGSNRFDFWRVARGEFARHPLAGDGARGFGPAYLVHGRSVETPRRAHSLPLDVLAETGAIGFGLLALGLGAPLWIALRRARRGETVAVAALGGFVAWFVHSWVDWTWSFPAVTIPALVLLGAAAAARDGFGPVPPRTARVVAGIAVAASVLIFAPPWLSARYTERGIEARSASDLHRARALDPLATDPLLFEAWVKPPAEAIPQLQEAVRREPRMVATRQALGMAYLAVGRKADALEQLQAALRLYPRNRLLAKLVEQAR
jgi:hypothetical protein